MVGFNKRGVGFSQIVAVFGAVLIGLGVLWLVAQNWHVMPSAVKILILLVATGGAFAAGTMLRIKEFPGVAHALFVLGALLYTASVFLIAQIFSTATSLQGTAWLLLLSWVGVVAFAYLFASPGSLVIALVEALIWLAVQFFALRGDAPAGLLALSFLAVGALFYGLSLFHRAKDLAFAELFRWWTILYTLIFLYILSFQALMPILWTETIGWASSQMVFLGILVVGAAVSLTVGLIASKGSGVIPRWELLGAACIAVLSIVLIASMGVATNDLGTCYEKSCYELPTEESCAAGTTSSACVWRMYDVPELKRESQPVPAQATTLIGSCQEDSCYLYRNESSCNAQHEGFDCAWSNGNCDNEYCEKYNETDCRGAPASLDCVWSIDQWNVVPRCMEDNCYRYESRETCAKAPEKLSCAWNDNRYNMGCREVTTCGRTTEKDACIANGACSWNANAWYSFRDNPPLKVWFVWILVNIAFIGVILAIILYGTGVGASGIVNLGIAFFALDIITRYIGFLIDLWGYTSLALIFISGGVILLFGGYGIEKWRKSLVLRAKGNETKPVQETAQQKKVKGK